MHVKKYVMLPYTSNHKIVLSIFCTKITLSFLFNIIIIIEVVNGEKSTTTR
jgi:hypothetical protein